VVIRSCYCLCSSSCHVVMLSWCYLSMLSSYCHLVMLLSQHVVILSSCHVVISAWRQLCGIRWCLKQHHHHGWHAECASACTVHSEQVSPVVVPCLLFWALLRGAAVICCPPAAQLTVSQGPGVAVCCAAQVRAGSDLVQLDFGQRPQEPPSRSLFCEVMGRMSPQGMMRAVESGRA